MPQTVGVLAIQGDFAKHLEVLEGLQVAAREVRVDEDLAAVDRLIIPGGESSTVGLLLERYGLGKAISERAGQGMPIWGTCMGMIMLAKEVEDREQYRLGLLDVTVRRNAFGAQVHSFETELVMKPLPEPVTAVFIRAPIVTRMGPNVQVLSEYEGKIVAVQEGRILGTSFHPELTGDSRVHEYFLTL